MKKYHIKRLVPGFKLGRQYAGKNYVAIPKVSGSIMVLFDLGMMVIKDWKESKLRLSFPDKFGRGGRYVLGYFEWRPSEQIPLI